MTVKVVALSDEERAWAAEGVRWLAASRYVQDLGYLMLRDTEQGARAVQAEQQREQEMMSVLAARFEA